MTDDKPTWTFAWPDRIDAVTADHEKRIAELERQVALLTDLGNNFNDRLTLLRQAVLQKRDE